MASLPTQLARRSRLSPPMKVAIVCPYSLKAPGGVQTHTQGLAQALTEQDACVTLFAPQAEGKRDSYELQNLGAAIRIPYNGSVAPLGVDPRMIFLFEHTLDAFDVIHLHEPFLPACLAALARRPRGTPVVATFHAAAARSKLYEFASPLLKRLATKLAKSAAVSEAAGELPLTCAGLEPVIIPNGIDTKTDEPPDSWAQDLGRSILFVGRPEPRKGFDLMLRIFRHIQEKIPAIHLICVPAEGQSSGTMHFLGHVSEKKLAGLRRAATITCVPSKGGESFGMTVLEAMASGSPTIVSDLPSYRQVAQDTVLYANPQDQQDWAGKIVQLLGDQSLQSKLKQQAITRAKDFDWEVIARRITHDLYGLA